MSYYENQQWQAGASQGQGASWEQQTPPARSGASSAVPREESTAFSSQFEEVDRAVDNLVKSGKMFNMPGRRETNQSIPGPGRPFSEQFDPRMPAGPPRHHSLSDFGDARSFSGSNLQNFYANQRHQPSRGANEADQVMQAKRRMAAQRERELRNYHQEQQYNRSVVAEISAFGGKPDRTMSPASGMSEEERRELIARQRNALYGEGASFSDAAFDENGTPRPGTRGSGSQSATGIRGHSPLAFDHYNPQVGSSDATAQGAADSTSQPPQPRSRANSTASPASNPNGGFALFDAAAQASSRTSTSSPGGSPPGQVGNNNNNNNNKAPTNASVAPIGTRPNATAPNPALSKRSTTPLPSPLSYGFAASNEADGASEPKDARAPSAASNPTQGQDVNLGWGSKSGVWGKNSLGVQASVWG